MKEKEDKIEIEWSEKKKAVWRKMKRERKIDDSSKWCKCKDSRKAGKSCKSIIIWVDRENEIEKERGRIFI